MKTGFQITKWLLPGGFLTVLLIAAGCVSSDTSDLSSLSDPPEVTIGERLFLETRFAQFFATHSGSDVNKALPLGTGDPVMDETVSTGDPLPGPFKGKTMNCRSCHLVDEQFETPGGGMRTYDDFSRHSPIPDRGDGLSVTSRNSPPLVNATLERNGIDLFLHFDGEFASIEDLVRETLTGRNFGWLPSEQDQAVAHIARIIREDNGHDDFAQETGGLSYTVLLLGADPKIPASLRLSAAFQLDVQTATDQEILDTVAKLISAYVNNLRFGNKSAQPDSEYNKSPYDVFLAKNNLPRKPDPGESEIDYSRRLLQAVEAIGSPQFVAHDGSFETHSQLFIFGAKEFQGLKIFFREGTSPLSSGVGNCIACHVAPNFTDFHFHNTGVTQREYDQLHGSGALMALSIPDLASRQADLPPTPAHPNGTGRFRAVPSATDPEKVDLGLWNVFANDDFPAPQAGLLDFMCDEFGVLAGSCANDALLPFSIAYFKAPTLRDLGHSNPYMHNGQFDALSDVVEHYRIVSEMARGNQLRNPSEELSGIRLSSGDTEAVVHFLKALDEDYE